MRRQKSKQQSTKDSILDSAQSIFIKRGFADTSLAMIGRAANVSKSLIHHYFGSKDELWTEVKKRLLDDYFRAQAEDLASPKADARQLKDAIIRFFDLLRNSPELVRLFLWHMLEEDREIHPAETEITQVGVERIREAQQNGYLRHDIDARYIVVVFLGLVEHWFQAKTFYMECAGIEADPRSADYEYLENMLKIFFEGVLPNGEKA